jgi:hypothetical protein
MVRRKADFQMSMGMIVAVVFAIILLSLAITWIQGLFGDISTITHKTTDVAQQQLLKELAASGKKVGIAAPAVTAWSKGETGSYAIGIKNDQADRGATYYVNVYLEAIGGELSGSTVTQYATETKAWLTYPQAKDIAAGERDIMDLIIRPPASTSAGIYTFTIAVCTGSGDTTNCHATSPSAGFTTKSTNLYGSATFALEIKA